jgi:hypothetical protein
MKKARIGFILAVLLTVVLSSTASAQYPGYAWSTAYQVVNMGTVDASIHVDYYDSTGNVVTGASKDFNAVPPGGSQLVVQYIDDPNLGSGLYSAVISASQPVAAIVNQQLVPNGSATYNPVPPFASYTGEGTGSSTLTLSAVMYNWYGYFTDVFIMNVGAAAATNVDIAYIPGAISGVPTGASGVTDLNNPIAQYATLEKSQQSLSSLGAPGGTYNGRFLGSATITSDQPIIAVVNQHNVSAYKLMTYNGFTTAGSTDIADPNHMRGYFGYYSTLLVANPSATTTANVTLTYTPDTAKSVGTNAPVTVGFAILPQTSLTRYDGSTATAAQSDLLPFYTRFFGSVHITSDIPVVAQINVEAVATGDDQAGSFTGIPVSSATPTIVLPVVLADYYGYYTTSIIQNVTGTGGSCTIAYTSDGTYSAVKNHSASYVHALPANGTITVYEGRKGGQEIGDINHDTQWRSGSAKQFIGAATVTCTVNAVAFENEEKDLALKDSMYTFNAFNK